MTRVLTVALLLLAVGCTSSWGKLRVKTNSFLGENVTGFIQWLGVPDREIEIENGAIYTWDMYDKGGRYRCAVTVTVLKPPGRITQINDNCPN